MKVLQLKPLSESELSKAVELDRLCFGGLWTLEGYQREVESSKSDLLGLWMTPSPPVPLEFTSDSQVAPPIHHPVLIGIGCLWSILEEAHITVLGIHPEFRQQGLGQAMLIALLTCAVYRQLERATLEVRNSNDSAIALYQKFGFQQAGRRRGYYQDTGEDALILWKNGLHFPEFQRILKQWHSQIQNQLTHQGWLIDTQLFFQQMLQKA